MVGLLVALVLLGGGGYLLAAGGSNIPVLFSLASGLSGNGKTASTTALAYVKAQNSYAFGSDIQLSPLTDKDKPGLPTSTNVETPVYILHGVSDSAYYTKNGDYSGYAQVTVNSGTAVPLALHAPVTGTWSVIFPGSDTPTAQPYDSTNLSSTVLYSVVHPMPLDTLLGSVVSSQSMDKRTSNGKVVSAYSVVLDPSKFKAYFPSDVTLSNFVGVIELSWKGSGQITGQPVAALAQGTVTYKQRSYKFTENWTTASWNGNMPSNHTELASLSGVDSTAPALTLNQFIAQLGIGSLNALPNSVSDTGTTGTTTTTTAVTPTGESIDKVGATITTTPAIPTQPADANAKKRDTQRKQDIGLLQAALEKYKTDNGQYPASSGIEQTISSLTLFNALVPKYLTKMPVDPLPQTYWYEYQSDGQTFALRTVIEDQSDKSAKAGNVFYYYELVNK